CVTSLNDCIRRSSSSECSAKRRSVYSSRPIGAATKMIWCGISNESSMSETYSKVEDCAKTNSFEQRRALDLLSGVEKRVSPQPECQAHGQYELGRLFCLH